MSPNRTRMGVVQLRIMRVLWAHGEATARRITDEMCREKKIAHSTVQTLLRKLEKKGAVDHTVVDRTFVFRPKVAEEDVVDDAASRVVKGFFKGSAYGLVAHLVKSEKIPPDELDEIRKLIEGGGKGKRK